MNTVIHIFEMSLEPALLIAGSLGTVLCLAGKRDAAAAAGSVFVAALLGAGVLYLWHHLTGGLIGTVEDIVIAIFTVALPLVAVLRMCRTH